MGGGGPGWPARHRPCRPRRARRHCRAPRCAAGIPQGAGGAPLFTTAPEPWNPSAPNEQAPDQWLAKLYTETLGCAPGQASYARYHAFVADAGCGVATLRAAALAFLTSRAFRRTPYTNAQRLLVLWRVARESEPEPAVYARQLAALRSRRLRWAQVARAMLQPDGFGAVAARACSGQNYGWGPEARSTSRSNATAERSATPTAPSCRRSSTVRGPAGRSGSRGER